MGRAPCMNGSFITSQLADTEGKVPQRLPLAIIDEPSARTDADKLYLSNKV